MKEYIIAFCIALVATSWVYTSGGPPQDSPVGVKNVVTATKRRTYSDRDSTIDNFNMADKSIEKTIMTDVVDMDPNIGTAQSVPRMGAER